MPTTTVEGRKVHFVHHRPVPAKQPPVVFIHGAGGTHQHWLYQVRDLPAWPTYAPDLPGHGRSEGPGRDSIPSYGDWLLAFLDTAELDRAVLVGHSMGGAIALHLALHHPSRLAGLGLVATGARLRVAPQILDGVLQDTEAAVRLICDWAYGPDASPEMVRLGRRQMGAIPADVLHGDFIACDGFSVMDRLGEIKMPAAVVCGTRDQLTPVKYSTTLRDQIVGSSLQLVEGAGHMVMLENPRAVLQALSSLMANL
jgi:pimeloyl-ACP methyl ester carboxylesterase